MSKLWSKLPGELGFEKPRSSNVLDPGGGSYQQALKRAMLDYYTDDTIASAGAGMYLAVVLRVEYDGDVTKVDASERFIQNNNWADLFYGDPELFQLENNTDKQDPPRLMKIRARIPELDYYKPVPTSESDEERMRMHSVFTAISEDVTALGVPSPGELIWVGFASVADATYPYYVTRVKSTRPVAQPAAAGGINAFDAHNSGQSAQLGQYKGASQIARHTRPIYDLFFGTGNPKYNKGERGFINWREYLLKNPNYKKGLFKGNKEGIMFDSKYGALARFTANAIKTMGVVAIIEQYLNAYDNTQASVRLTSALRTSGSDNNHGNALAIDLKIIINGKAIPKEQTYAIVARLIKDKKLPVGGLGMYLGVSKAKGDRAGEYVFDFEKNANVHYDHRGASVGPTWAPTFKTGGSRWIWICLDSEDPNGRCKGARSKAKWQLKLNKKGIGKWEKKGNYYYSGDDDPNSPGQEFHVSSAEYEKLKLLANEPEKLLPKSFQPANLEVYSLSKYEEAVWSDDTLRQRVIPEGSQTLLNSEFSQANSSSSFMRTIANSRLG